MLSSNYVANSIYKYFIRLFESSFALWDCFCVFCCCCRPSRLRFSVNYECVKLCVAVVYSCSPASTTHTHTYKHAVTHTHTNTRTLRARDTHAMEWVGGRFTKFDASTQHLKLQVVVVVVVFRLFFFFVIRFCLFLEWSSTATSHALVNCRACQSLFLLLESSPSFFLF